MSLSDADKLAKYIADIANQQDDIKQNLNPDDPVSTLQLVSSEELEIYGNSLGIARYLASTSFVIDHPVYGDIDSATLHIDGGYLDSVKGFSVPITMPMTFSSGTSGTEELWNITF